MKGEILLAARFADQGGGSALAAVVGGNMRAVSVRVNDVVGVAGFLLPGNRVDVVAAYRERADTHVRDGRAERQGARDRPVAPPATRTSRSWCAR